MHVNKIVGQHKMHYFNIYDQHARWSISFAMENAADEENNRLTCRAIVSQPLHLEML